MDVFSNVTAAFPHHDEQSKAARETFVNAGGLVVQDDDTLLDVIVFTADNTSLPKSLCCALQRNIPVVSHAWVTDSVRQGKLQSPWPYTSRTSRNQFAGLRIAFTGISPPSLLAQMMWLAEHHGGRVDRSVHLTETDILVCHDNTTRRARLALINSFLKVKVVRTEWFVDSLRLATAADPASYEVPVPYHEDLAARARRDAPATPPTSPVAKRAAPEDDRDSDAETVAHTRAARNSNILPPSPVKEPPRKRTKHPTPLPKPLRSLRLYVADAPLSQQGRSTLDTLAKHQVVVTTIKAATHVLSARAKVLPKTARSLPVGNEWWLLACVEKSSILPPDQSQLWRPLKHSVSAHSLTPAEARLLTFHQQPGPATVLAGPEAVAPDDVIVMVGDKVVVNCVEALDKLHALINSNEPAIPLVVKSPKRKSCPGPQRTVCFTGWRGACGTAAMLASLLLGCEVHREFRFTHPDVVLIPHPTAESSPKMMCAQANSVTMVQSHWLERCTAAGCIVDFGEDVIPPLATPSTPTGLSSVMTTQRTGQKLLFGSPCTLVVVFGCKGLELRQVVDFAPKGYVRTRVPGAADKYALNAPGTWKRLPTTSAETETWEVSDLKWLLEQLSKATCAAQHVRQ